MEGGREYYLIERDSLPHVHEGKHEHTLDAHPPAERTEIAAMLAHRLEDLVQRYGKELGSVREELGAERVRRELAEQKAARLEVELEALREPRDAPETVTSDTSSPETPASDTEQPRRSWWRRFFGFE